MVVVGKVVSFRAGRWELNWETRTDLDLVTDLASFANLERPPLLSSVSMGCFRAVMSRNVSRNRTTRSRSFLMGAICSSSHSGVSEHRKEKENQTSRYILCAFEYARCYLYNLTLPNIFTERSIL